MYAVINAAVKPKKYNMPEWMFKQIFIKGIDIDSSTFFLKYI